MLIERTRNGTWGKMQFMTISTALSGVDTAAISFCVSKPLREMSITIPRISRNVKRPVILLTVSLFLTKRVKNITSMQIIPQ